MYLFSIQISLIALKTLQFFSTSIPYAAALYLLRVDCIVHWMEIIVCECVCVCVARPDRDLSVQRVRQVQVAIMRVRSERTLLICATKLVNCLSMQRATHMQHATCSAPLQRSNCIFFGAQQCPSRQIANADRTRISLACFHFCSSCSSSCFCCCCCCCFWQLFA